MVDDDNLIPITAETAAAARIRGTVAPHAGAWIETCAACTATATTPKSRPMRARGLKQPDCRRLSAKLLSRPMQARGLKQYARELRVLA